MNVNDILKKAATKKSTKPSTEMIELEVAPGLLSSHKVKYDALKSAKVDLALSEEELLSAVKPQYREAIKKKYVNSARLSEDDIEATVSWKDAYTKIPVEKTSELKELVGEQFHDFFEEVNSIVVKSDITSDEDSLAELIEDVGPDKFAKYFDVTQHLKPTSRFTQERYRELSSDTNEKLDVTVRQYKPSVRMKSK